MSKNNEDDAMSIIENHPHMVLKPKDFAITRINWENKAENIVSISKELNIGLESFVFIDDNKSEQALIKKVLPEVVVVDFPSRPEELATGIDGSKRSSIYYCEPNRSDQKAKVEKNHEYIRYIIPKGTSMDNYVQDDIDLMMSHINSTAREVLNFAIPYDMASIYIGMDTMKKLNIYKIQPDDIILKPYLINKKK